MLSSLLIQTFLLLGTGEAPTRRSAHFDRWSPSARHRYVCCLQTLRALRNLKLNFRPLLEAPIAVRLNGREVDEYIFAILPLDESIALRRVKPFHCAFFFHVLPFQLLLQLELFPGPPKKMGDAVRHTRVPQLLGWLKSGKSQMHNHYTQKPPVSNPEPKAISRSRAGGWPLYSRNVQFEFLRLRFHFKAIGMVLFGNGSSANTLRGAFGSILRCVACRPECGPARHVPDCPYARIFEPGSTRPGGPSGFADWPRPFVFRTRHLDGRTLQPGEHFHFDIHVFDLEAPVRYFAEALRRLATEGLGPGRGRAELVRIEQLATDDQVMARALDGADLPATFSPYVLPLDADTKPKDTVRMRFLTPTEIKCGRLVAARPEFPMLFGRARDRLSTLRALYGPGPLEIDFRGMGERAANVQMTRCDLRVERIDRRSSRTGQVHPLGGFTGEAEYRGNLTEFLPYLRAARWTGVGRQTVWGKGEIEVVE
jgi:hypothetical protein